MVKITYIHTDCLHLVIETSKQKLEVMCADGPVAGLRKAAEEKRKAANQKLFEAALMDMAIEQILRGDE